MCRVINDESKHKNFCINHASNGNKALCPFRALARRIVSIRKHSGNPSIFLSAYFQKGKRHDVNNNNISTYLKWGAAVLNYPSRGISINPINTYYLRGVGAMTLHLNGYSDRQIMKMGRWRSNTFMEYICEHLDKFSEGVSKAMAKRFQFVNVQGGTLHNVTILIVSLPDSVTESSV